MNSSETAVKWSVARVKVDDYVVVSKVDAGFAPRTMVMTRCVWLRGHRLAIGTEKVIMGRDKVYHIIDTMH